MGKKALKDLAKGMLIKERTALEGMKRALRRLKVQEDVLPSTSASSFSLEIEIQGSDEVGGPSAVRM